MTIKTKITNFLIAQILDNSPEADVVKTKFPNFYKMNILSGSLF